MQLGASAQAARAMQGSGLVGSPGSREAENFLRTQASLSSLNSLLHFQDPFRDVCGQGRGGKTGEYNDRKKPSLRSLVCKKSLTHLMHGPGRARD